MNWILDRLKEPTTWAGIIATLAGGFGIMVPEEMSTAIAAAGMAVAGLILIVIKQKSSP